MTCKAKKNHKTSTYCYGQFNFLSLSLLDRYLRSGNQNVFDIPSSLMLLSSITIPGSFGSVNWEDDNVHISRLEFTVI